MTLVEVNTEAPMKCKEGQWQCLDGDCIHSSFLCDTQNDCIDKSDEDKNVCELKENKLTEIEDNKQVEEELTTKKTDEKVKQEKTNSAGKVKLWPFFLLLGKFTVFCVA